MCTSIFVTAVESVKFAHDLSDADRQTDRQADRQTDRGKRQAAAGKY